MSTLNEQELNDLAAKVGLTRDHLDDILTKSSLTDEELDGLSAIHQEIKIRPKKKHFYEEYLYPALRDTFKEQKLADDPDVKILLLPISNPHLPVLAAARWKPKIAFALYSTLSKKHHQAIQSQIQALDLGIEYQYKDISNIDDPTELYHVIKETIKSDLNPSNHNPHIAVDITGGTKVMSVAAAMAISFVEGHLFYIKSRALRGNIQERAAGTEEAKRLNDPYLVFGDIKREQAKELYRQHDYLGAARIFDELAGRITPSQGDKQWAKLAQAYAAWDAFDLKQAHKLMQSLIRLLRHTSSIRNTDQKTLKQQALILKELYRIASDVTRGTSLDILKDVEHVLRLLGSLYQNALRRETSGRYDMAALLLYRCLELMSQRRLATYNINPSRPQYDQTGIYRRDLNNKYQEIIGRYFRNPSNLPNNNISLFNGYVILEALEDVIVNRDIISRIRERVQMRNQSILAHGFRLITKHEYTEFKAVVDELLIRFFQAEGHNQDKWLKAYKFIEVL